MALLENPELNNLSQYPDFLHAGSVENLSQRSCEFKKNKYLCNSKIEIDFKVEKQNVFNNGEQEGNLQDVWQIRS